MEEHISQEPRSRRAPRSGWLVAGLVAGILLAPTAAVAAGVSVYSLVGPNGTKAAVTKAGQLQTTTIDPTMIRAFSDSGYTGGNECTRDFTVPHGKSLILTDATWDIWRDPTPGSGNDVWLSTASNCSSFLMDYNPGSVGAQEFTFGQGIVVTQGHSVYASSAGGNLGAEYYAHGYLVPSADAPNPTSYAAVQPASAKWPLLHRVHG